jgi:hypothetical protein
MMQMKHSRPTIRRQKKYVDIQVCSKCSEYMNVKQNLIIAIQRHWSPLQVALSCYLFFCISFSEISMYRSSPRA